MSSDESSHWANKKGKWEINHEDSVVRNKENRMVYPFSTIEIGETLIYFKDNSRARLSLRKEEFTKEQINKIEEEG